jgi:6-pyruvoyl-tetrahydropterin synthase
VFDVNLLDRMNFGDLRKTLDHVLEKMDQLKEEGSDDEDDPRYDALMVIANQIIERMDSVIRDNVVDSSEILDQWKRQTEEYRKGFKDYVRTYLKGGVPLLMAEPEGSSLARGEDADAAWRAKLDEIVLDEKLLDGMNAGDLFQVNNFITENVKEFDEKFPEDVADPIITKLLKFGDIVIRRLDPLVRETYKDKPEKLAEWVAIMDDYKDLDDEDAEDAGADIKSSAVS